MDEMPHTLPGEDPRPLAQDQALLETEGFCILPHLVPAGLLAQVQRRLAEQAQAERSAALSGRDDAQIDQTNQYVYALINKGDPFLELVLHPVILDLVRNLIGEEFLLSAADGIIAHPGGSLAPLHTDQWWMPPPVRRGSRHAPVGSIQRNHLSSEGAALDSVTAPAVCTVMWMISPFSDANGGTRLVPRSHLSGQHPDPAIPHPVETIAACGAAGSAVVLDGRLWHSTGANRTTTPRLGIVTTYCGPQFRPMENYTIGAREELLTRQPDPLLRQLLGFKVWQGYGKVDNPRDVFVDRAIAPAGPLP